MLRHSARRVLFVRTLAAFAAVLVTFSAIAQTTDSMGMVTGGPKGTYIQFGKDLARIARPVGLDIQVKESQGSLDNIERMESKENAAFGIVQSDVLGYLKKLQDGKSKRTASGLRLVFPFYEEEVHVLARNEVTKLEDLKGKRVNVGPEKSGSWLTATNLFKILGIVGVQEFAYDNEEALAKVLGGELDAMFYVAGKPVPLFSDSIAKMKQSPRFAPLVEEIHFVPIEDSRVFEEYGKAKLGPKDYPWVKSEADTASVRAVLVSFDFSRNQSEYYRKRCEQLALLGRVIRDKLTELQSPDDPNKGHVKWQQVDLDRDVEIWTRDRCSTRGANRVDRPSEKGHLKEDLKKCIEKGEC